MHSSGCGAARGQRAALVHRFPSEQQHSRKSFNFQRGSPARNSTVWNLEPHLVSPPHIHRGQPQSSLWGLTWLHCSLAHRASGAWITWKIQDITRVGDSRSQHRQPKTQPQGSNPKCSLRVLQSWTRCSVSPSYRFPYSQSKCNGTVKN